MTEAPAARTYAGREARSLLRDVRARLDQPIRHLYVHTPFCQQLCPYCDFNSYAGRDDLIDAYLEALATSLATWAPHLAPTTIFIGGGTPSHGTVDQFRRLLFSIRDGLPLGALQEWTVEANPGTVDVPKIQALCDAGVTRVSLGAQSFHDAHLKTLGRAHDARAIVRSAELLRRNGSLRLSLDLILAVPGQRLGEQAHDARRAMELAPDHVSAYVLTYERGTGFDQQWKAGVLPGPDAERERAHMDCAHEVFTSSGLCRYEVSNYAKPGGESQHNLAYWRNDDWIGIGAGAHGHVDGMRWVETKDPAAYVEAVRSHGDPVSEAEVVRPHWRMIEALMMGLRLRDGVDVRDIAARTSIDPAVVCGDVASSLVKEGVLAVEGPCWRVTPAGVPLLNAIVGRLASA